MISLLHRYNLTHPLLGLCMFLPFAAFGLPWVGVAFSTGFYLGREVTQVERKAGPWSPETWWHGFDLRNWDRGNHLDFWPVAVVTALAATLI